MFFSNLLGIKKNGFWFPENKFGQFSRSDSLKGLSQPNCGECWAKMLFYIFTDVSCEVKGKCTSQLKCNLTNLNKTNLVKCEAENLLGKCSKFQSIEIPQTCGGWIGGRWYIFFCKNLHFQVIKRRVWIFDIVFHYFPMYWHFSLLAELPGGMFLLNNKLSDEVRVFGCLLCLYFSYWQVRGDLSVKGPSTC